MATLVDNELFDYLGHLKEEVNKRIFTSNNESLQHLAHSQMGKIIDVEIDFLRYINSNGTKPILSISPNGLPSVSSLNPDLEKICELSDEENPFFEVAQAYKTGVNGKNRGENGHLYVPVSEEEWNKELTNRSKEKLQNKIGFAVSETDDGKFELSIKEDVYLKGYDRHSKEFPVLIREGKMKYHVVWNKLVEDIEESFYVPNTALVLQGRALKPTKKQFDDVTRMYEFGRRDFKGVSKPWFLRWRGDSIDYSAFLAAGTNSRIRITENILEALGKTLDKQVILKGVRKNDLEQTLAFVTVPFKNAPRTTPKEEDLYEDTKKYSGSFTKGEPKNQTKFDLIFTTGGDKMGEIEYILPHNKNCYGAYGGHYYRFTKGGIRLTVLGESIWNENQYHSIQESLRNVRKR